MKSPLAALHGDRDPLAAYVRTHIAGATAGIRLFAHSAEHQDDPEIRAVLLDIRAQLLEERDHLQERAERLGPGENPILSTLAALGEKASRLKPTDWGRPASRLAELEAMRVALAGKLAGWEAMLSVVDEYDELDRARLERFRDQAIEQQRRVTEVHVVEARRTLRPT